MSKPKPGDVLPKSVASNNNTPCLHRVSVAVLGLHPGDTVEITYGADEIVIRRPQQATDGGEG